MIKNNELYGLRVYFKRIYFVQYPLQRGGSSNTLNATASFCSSKYHDVIYLGVFN